jgi:hypothetical protein
MSEQVENVFDLLDDEDREEREEKEEEEAAGSAQDTTKDNKTNNLSIETESAVQMEESSADSSWTDVSSTKTRKVAIPVGSLFKQDTATPARGSSTTTTVPAPASSSSSAAAAAASQSSSDSQKKKGLLAPTCAGFTLFLQWFDSLERSCWLSIDQPNVFQRWSTSLRSLLWNTSSLSVATKSIPKRSVCPPLCLLSSLTDQIMKIWNSTDPNKPAANNTGGRGRGRGRGRNGESVTLPRLLGDPRHP